MRGVPMTRRRDFTASSAFGVQNRSLCFVRGPRRDGTLVSMGEGRLVALEGTCTKYVVSGKL